MTTVTAFVQFDNVAPVDQVGSTVVASSGSLFEFANDDGTYTHLYGKNLARDYGVVTDAYYYDKNWSLKYVANDANISLRYLKYYSDKGDNDGLRNYAYREDDAFYGSPFADVISGYAGSDFINGAGGADTLTGGAGADEFSFIYSSKTATLTRDVVTDFHSFEGDKIDLSYIDANATAPKNQSFSFITGNTFTSPAQVRFDNATHLLHGNTDADATPEFSILLSGVTGLKPTDVIL